MSEEDEQKKGMSRRSFLKDAAVVMGTGILAGCAPKVADLTAKGTAPAGGTAVPGSPASKRPFGYMCDEDWLGQAPVIDDKDIATTVTVDVVICGGGHAGTQAALAAAQLGKTVAVIEKQPADKYAFKGDDICSYNSKFMLDKGFGPYDTGEIVAEFVKRGAGRCSPEIISLFVENSGEMFDNMISLVPSTSNLLTGPQQYIVQVAYGKDKGTDYPIEQGGYKSWATTMQTIGTINPNPVNGRSGVSRLTELELYVMAEAVKKGAKWYHEFDVSVLTQNADGDVTGAIAKGPDGKYTKFVANKGVLLATGDFAANPDMVWELVTEIPEWAERAGEARDKVIGMSTSTGTGQKLGCWAGGFMEPNPRPTMAIGGGGGGPWGTAPFLWLNALGKRFMNEAQTPASYIQTLRQPIGNVCTVTDSKWMQTVQGASIDHGAANWGYPAAFETLKQQMSKVMGTGAKGCPVQQVAIINVEMMKAEPGKGMMDAVVFGANTLEELAGYLGYQGDALKSFLASVEAYNKQCTAGKDTQFGKEARLMIPIDTAPFYGVIDKNTGNVTTGLVTLAGLVTNPSLQVLKKDRMTPIKGLFAAGNCLGQRYGNSYTTASAGNSMGMAMTHGRMAGKIIASS
jgi:succinate dehydrogenase/fumarate reductase flavoprotein subunit